MAWTRLMHVLFSLQVMYSRIAWGAAVLVELEEVRLCPHVTAVPNNS